MATKRKLIGFDRETWQALELLSRDSGKNLQGLTDEAFADLLVKQHRPRTLKEALKQSSRREPSTRIGRRSGAAPVTYPAEGVMAHNTEQEALAIEPTIFLPSSFCRRDKRG